VLGPPAHRLRCLHNLTTRPSHSIYTMSASPDRPRPPPSMASSDSATTITGKTSSPLNPAHTPSPSATPTPAPIALASPPSSNVLLPSLSRSRGSSFSSPRGRASPPTPLSRALSHPDAQPGASTHSFSALRNRGNSASSVRAPSPGRRGALLHLDTPPNAPPVRWWDKRPVRGARPWADEPRRKGVPEEQLHAYVHTRHVRAVVCAGGGY
jgi:hypothetical protein